MSTYSDHGALVSLIFILVWPCYSPQAPPRLH